VLNADDPLLVEAARELEMPIRWFSLDEANPVVQQSIDAGGWAAVCRGDWVVMAAAGESWPVAPIAEIPITLGGAAVHNVANVLAAVATASTLGVTTGQIAESLRTFGLSPRDNPGRLQVRAVHGATVIVDFVHNPDGWQAILQMVARLRTQRLIVTLGQAGDRDDIALHDLAEAVWHGRPDLIVLKEMEDYLRGRPYGQTSGVLASALHDAGAPPERVRHAPTELEAAQMALRAARPGDVVVIATHSHYKDVLALVDAAASATARHPLES
jgi:UDP-N-acetylmuramyl tripeptide synthase